MPERQTRTLELSLDEFVLLEELLQDYQNRLRHEAQLELDFAGDKERSQMYVEQAAAISDLQDKFRNIDIAQGGAKGR